MTIAVERFTLLVQAKPMPIRTIVQMVITSSAEAMLAQKLTGRRGIQVISEIGADGIVDVESFGIDSGEQRDGTEDRADDAGKAGIHDDGIGLPECSLGPGRNFEGSPEDDGRDQEIKQDQQRAAVCRDNE